MRALALAAVLLAAALLPAPGLAFHDPDAALLDERTTQGPTWVAYRAVVSSPLSVSSVEIEPASVDAAQVAYGLYLVRASDQRTVSFFIGTGDVPATEVLVDDDELGQAVHAGPLLGYTGRTNGFASTYTDLAPDTYWYVVVNTAPSAGQATVRFFGSAAVALMASAQGTAGNLFREADFDAPMNVQARVGAAAVVPFGQAHAGVIKQGRIGLEVQHKLFGIFQSLYASPNDVGWVGPDGLERSGQTTYVLSNRAAGSYTFKADDWAVLPPRLSAGSGGYIALLVADVALP